MKNLSIKDSYLSSKMSFDDTCCSSNDIIDRCEDMPIAPPDEPEAESDVTVRSNFCQWSVDGVNFFPTANTMKELPAGYYTIETSPQFGNYFSKQEVLTNKLYRLPNEAVNIIMNDIDKFWTIKENYQKYNRVYRRNYLLYSAPGTGKTSLINLMCHDLINKYNGVVVSLRSETDIYNYHEVIKMFRAIEPERKMIVVIEDIDNFTSNGSIKRSSLESTLLNILDGNFKFDNTVIIATTNYPEDLAERYTNRPSRFDKVIEFPLPNSESRRMFITSTVDKNDLEKINLDKWVELTENYSIDHLNELILLFFVFGHSEAESFDIMNNMIQKKGIIKNEISISNKAKIGFNN